MRVQHTWGGAAALNMSFIAPTNQSLARLALRRTSAIQGLARNRISVWHRSYSFAGAGGIRSMQLKHCGLKVTQSALARRQSLELAMCAPRTTHAQAHVCHPSEGHHDVVATVPAAHVNLFRHQSCGTALCECYPWQCMHVACERRVDKQASAARSTSLDCTCASHP